MANQIVVRLSAPVRGRLKAIAVVGTTISALRPLILLLDRIGEWDVIAEHGGALARFLVGPWGAVATVGGGFALVAMAVVHGLRQPTITAVSSAFDWRKRAQSVGEELLEFVKVRRRKRWDADIPSNQGDRLAAGFRYRAETVAGYARDFAVRIGGLRQEMIRSGIPEAELELLSRSPQSLDDMECIGHRLEELSSPNFVASVPRLPTQNVPDVKVNQGKTRFGLIEVINPRGGAAEFNQANDATVDRLGIVIK